MFHGVSLGGQLPAEETLRSFLLVLLALVVAFSFLVAFLGGIYRGFKTHLPQEWLCSGLSRDGSWRHSTAAEVGGFFLAVFLAILADHWTVYVVVVLLAAVLFVDEEFVHKLASAISRQPKVEIFGAGPVESRCKELIDLIERGELSQVEDQLQEHRNRHWALLTTALEALVDKNLFKRGEIQRNVAILDRASQRRLLIDAIAETEADVLLIEVKSQVESEDIERGHNHLHRAIHLFEDFLEERGRSKKVRGLLVTPPSEHLLTDSEIFHLATSREGDSESISSLQTWL